MTRYLEVIVIVDIVNNITLKRRVIVTVKGEGDFFCEQVGLIDRSNIMQYYNYTIVIEPDEDAFHAYVPALRGCHSCGDTYQEAKDNIKEAIELYLESLFTNSASRVPFRILAR